ncbi:MAG: ankyrin repeat domain-containing protein [Nibricoccus sp.]
MNPEAKAILDKVASTSDFGYVDFTDINTTNELGENALHCVIVWDDLAAARVLIENGINLNQRGEDGRTPLVQAIDFGNLEMIELLLKSGADSSIRPDGEPPFTYAKLMGREDICQLISKYPSQTKDESTTRKIRHMQRLTESMEKLEQQIARECGPKTEANTVATAQRL